MVTIPAGSFSLNRAALDGLSVMMSKKILGVEIQADAICAASILSGFKGLRMISTERLPLEEGESPEQGLHRFLETLSGRMDLGGVACVLSIPAEYFILRNVRLPFGDSKKIRQILPYEIEPSLPLPLDDLVIDFHSLSSNGSQDSGQVLAASIEKAKIESLLHACAGHGLEPEILTVAGVSTAVCLSRTASLPSCWIYAVLTRKRCTVSIVEGGQVVMIRSLAVDLDREDGTQDLCRQMDHVRLLAENLYGKRFDPGLVLLSGPVPGDLSAILSERFECPVEGVDFLHRAHVKWAPDTAPASISEHTDNALALTLAEMMETPLLNFRRGPFATKTRWLEYKRPILHSGVLLSVVLVLAFALLALQIRTLSRNVDRLQMEVQKVFKSSFPEAKRINSPQQQVQMMRQKVQELRRQLESSGSAQEATLKIDLLQSLSEKIPGNIDVEITRMVMAPDSITISGTTLTFNAVDEIKGKLEKDPRFKTVTINSANLEKTDERVSFKMRIDL